MSSVVLRDIDLYVYTLVSERWRSTAIIVLTVTAPIILVLDIILGYTDTETLVTHCKPTPEYSFLLASTNGTLIPKTLVQLDNRGMLIFIWTLSNP